MAHSIFNALGDNLNRKETTRAEFQNLNFLILHPIFNEFFFYKTINFMGYLWNTKKKSHFISKRSLKGDKIPKYRILEGMFNTLDLILLLIFGV